MNKEKLLEEGLQVFKGLLKRVETAEKFVISQAPSVIKELLLEDLVMQVPAAILSFLFVVNGIWAVNKAMSLDWGYSGTSPMNSYCVVAIMVGGIATVFFISSLIDIAKILLCPRLFLIRKLKGLISGRA